MFSINGVIQGLMGVVALFAVSFVTVGLLHSAADITAASSARSLTAGTRSLGSAELLLRHEIALTGLWVREMRSDTALSRARSATDDEIQSVIGALEGAGDAGTSGHIRSLEASIEQLRRGADDAKRRGADALPGDWQTEAVAVILRLLTLRATISADASNLPEELQDLLMAQEEILRGIGNTVASLMHIEDLIRQEGQPLEAAHILARDASTRFSATIARARSSAMAHANAHGALDGGSKGGDPEAAEFQVIFDSILPLPVPEQSSRIALLQWTADARRSLENLRDVFFRLSDHAEIEFDARLQSAKALLSIWMVIGTLTVAGLIAGRRFVVREIVRPIEELRTALLQMIEGRPGFGLNTRGQLSEIHDLQDAARGLRASLRRRAALERERLKLHARLHESHRRTRDDLEAAAAVQAGMLPKATQLGEVQLTCRYMPSQQIGGDTYGVVERQSGGATAFLIDVAGHGAAAALASVAAHLTTIQAMRTRRADESLGELASRINAAWPRELPYFTMLLAEIDPAQGEGSFVQAGHPPPFLLREGQALSLLGGGGLPIGVLSNASYTETRFPFGPADSLVLATDGLSEAENGAQEAFTEDRVRSALEATSPTSADDLLDRLVDELRSWRGAADFDDDITVLLLRGMPENDSHRVAHRPDRDLPHESEAA